MGASWEGFVIEQVLGVLSATGQHVEPYYFRTNDQHELDLVLDFGTELWAMEIKLTSSPSSGDMDRLDKTAKLIAAKRRFLVSRTKHPRGARRGTSCNLPDFAQAPCEAMTGAGPLAGWVTRSAAFSFPLALYSGRGSG